MPSVRPRTRELSLSRMAWRPGGRVRHLSRSTRIRMGPGPACRRGRPHRLRGKSHGRAARAAGRARRMARADGCRLARVRGAVRRPLCPGATGPDRRLALSGVGPLSASMSSFFILSKAVMTLCDFLASGSASILGRTARTTCHDRPNLSLSQPHCWAFLSPPWDSLSQ